MSDICSLIAESERASWVKERTACLEETLGSHQDLIETALWWVAPNDKVDMTRVELLYGLAAATILDAEIKDQAVLELVNEQLQEKGVDVTELVREVEAEPANQ